MRLYIQGECCEVNDYDAIDKRFPWTWSFDEQAIGTFRW